MPPLHTGLLFDALLSAGCALTVTVVVAPVQALAPFTVVYKVYVPPADVLGTV